MSLPAGVTTCTVTFGSAVSYLGVEAVINATLTADRSIVHAATGVSLNPALDSLESGGPGYLVFAVPHVDQTGFIDGSGNNVTGWVYTLSGEIVFPNGTTTSFKRNFQALVGQSTIDLDLVPDGATLPAASAPTAVVASVAGQTGTVTADQLAAALAAPLAPTFVPIATAKAVAFSIALGA